MKAIICTKYGSPEVLELRDVEKPKPNDNEVLVKIHATTVNRTDSALLRAKPFISRFFTGLFKPKKPIIGSEFAGEIVAVGNNVSLYKVGDKVYGFNESGFGAHAQYMCILEGAALTIMPENISYEQAAASTEGAFYAYNFINKVSIKSGQKILVNGATGGIDSATVQLLSYYDVDITAVCGTNNLDLVKTLGANKVIDYTKEDFTRTDEKYNCIFDTVGKSSFAKCKPLLEPDGVYISSELGDWSQNILFALLTPVFGTKKVIFPMPTACKGSILFTKNLIEKEKFNPVIHRKYPLEQITEAYRYVEKGQKIGNVVITVAHDDLTT